MSAVLLAVFADGKAAESVRLRLFEDGFPTDRIDLTAINDPGHASLVPAATAHEKFLLHFRSLFDRADERSLADRIAERVEQGAATVTVLPRGPVETARAAEILRNEGALELAQHDLSNQALEHAASRTERPWISYLWPQKASKAHCIYCWLFEHEH
jgi:hypothetical protein